MCWKKYPNVIKRGEELENLKAPWKVKFLIAGHLFMRSTKRVKSSDFLPPSTTIDVTLLGSSRTDAHN